MSYRIAGRLGDATAFQNMINTCHAAGVKVVADTVVNHMAAGSGTGTGGSSYTKYNYPGLYSSYDMDDFAPATVSDYTNRANVQNCRARRARRPGHRRGVRPQDHRRIHEQPARVRRGRLPHRRGQAHPGDRSRQHQVAADQSVGVLEAGGHLRRRGGGPADRVHRQRRRPGVPVRLRPQAGLQQREPRLPQELRRGLGLYEQLRRGRVRRQPRHRAQRLDAQLQGRGELHPRQRLHAGLPVRRPGHQLRLRVVDVDTGPPGGGTVNACWQDGWKCQHAWPEIKSMVALQRHRGESVTDWWDDTETTRSPSAAAPRGTSPSTTSRAR